MMSAKLLPQEMEARDFCRIWFGIANLSIEDIVEFETEQGYRKRCVTVLAQVTGLSQRTVRSWGAGIKFEKMPQCYKLTLAYAIKAAEGVNRRAA